jgi:molecular chaperone IbpA
MTNLLNTFLNTSIGFDPFFDGHDNWITPRSGFPFHNIKKVSDKKYTIEIALAGFGKEDIDVYQTDEILTIASADHIEDREGKDSSKDGYITKGISKRYFKKQFQIADTVKVVKVKLENGMLYIHLENNRPMIDKHFDID